jgi:hypothetical protein
LRRLVLDEQEPVFGRVSHAETWLAT